MRKILISIITLLLTISSYGQYQSTFVVDSTNQVFGETLSIGTKVRDLSTLKEWILNVKALSTDSLPSVSKSEIPTMPMDNEITSYEYYVDDSFTTDTLTTLTNKFKSLDSVMYWLFNDYLGNNYGGFNGDYDGDDTIEGISDVDFQNIEIGSVISAFGDVSVMRYNNFVLKKGSYGINNNWVTLSNNTIGAAVNDLLIFYNKTYIYVTGTQNVSSSIYLPNVTIVNRGKIIGNNLTLLNVSSTIPVMPYSFIDDGGEIYLKGNTSRLYYELTTSASNVFDHICNLNFGNVYSEGLDYAIFVDRYSSLYSHYKISCNINTLGKGIKADQIKSLSTRGHIEALLEGVNINQVSQLTQFLSISTPTSITAFMLLGGTSSVHNNADVYGTIIGNLYIDFDYSNINIYGSVMNSTINVYATRTNVNILGSIGSYGNNCAFNSIGASNTIYVNKFNGDFTQTGNSSVIFGANQRLLSQTISAGYVAHEGTSVGYVGGNVSRFGVTNVSGTGVLNVNSNVYTDKADAITLSGGEININAPFYSIATNIDLINQSGGVLRLTSRLTSGNANTAQSLIKKSGGKLIVNGGELVVANNKPPIECTANTSDSRDIYWIVGTTNCNAPTVSVTQAFDGASFAPNFLETGTLIENTGL